MEEWNLRTLRALLQTLVASLQRANEQSDGQLLHDVSGSILHQGCCVLLCRWAAFGSLDPPDSGLEWFGSPSFLNGWVQREGQALEAICGEYLRGTSAAESGELGDLYGQLLGLQVVRSGDAIAVEFATSKKQSGSYYTPSKLTKLLVERSLSPLVEQAATSAQAMLSLRVCDFACGGGAFLLEVCRYLAERLTETKDFASLGPQGDLLAFAKQQVVRHCIYGMDLDPLAAQITRYALARCSGLTSQQELNQHIRLGDALQDCPSFPAFDAIVGNPPFVNAIESGPQARWKQNLKRHPLTGTADYAFYFASQAHRWTKPEGTVGLLLPQTFLNAPSARELREQLLRQRPPRFLHLPSENGLFSQANVRIVAVVLDGAKHETHEPLRIQHENWWACLHESGSEPLPGPHFLGKPGFRVSASMTAQLAYEVVPFLQDRNDTNSPRLVTAGLIEPGRCDWGKVRCRYLKRDYRHPVIQAVHPPPALAKRLVLARRPKILVAGVAGKNGGLEAFVDTQGQYCGAVSTYSIWHESDSLAELTALCDALQTDRVAALVQHRLAAAAMGNGLLTIRKSFLQDLIGAE